MEATSAAGAVVTYINPTATDVVDGVVTVTCVKASGSTFALGSNAVICTSTDMAGNSAATAFTIKVRHSLRLCFAALSGCLWLVFCVLFVVLLALICCCFVD